MSHPLGKKLVWLFLLASLAAVGARAQEDAKPRVRAITGFVRLDRTAYRRQIAEALAVLRAAKGEFAKQGYNVQTLRLVTQPLDELVSGESDTDALAFLKALDTLSAKEGFETNVGPAMRRDDDDPKIMHLLAQGLASLQHLSGNAIIADDSGIHWGVIRESAALIRYLADHSPHSQGNFNFAALAMVQPYGPFFPGTYHTGPGKQFSIGFQSANVVQDVFARTHGDFAASVAELSKQLTVHAKVAAAIGQSVATETGWSFMGMDLSPAPFGDVSIGAAIEDYTGARFGSSGTLTAAFVITTAVKAVPVKLVGYSGVMLPVLEDKTLARRWREGSYDTDSLLAYSSVCGIGLDTIPYPGDISDEQLARIVGDVAALAWKWHKPLSARLQPLKDKKAGEQTDFDSPYIFNTMLRALP